MEMMLVPEAIPKDVYAPEASCGVTDVLRLELTVNSIKEGEKFQDGDIYVIYRRQDPASGTADDASCC